MIKVFQNFIALAAMAAAIMSPAAMNPAMAQSAGAETSIAGAVNLSPAFTYQGFLRTGSTPANGTHDFEFALYEASAGGVQFGPTIAVNDLNVTDGLFTVELDFGEVFTNQVMWLEIAVRPGASADAHVLLTPRQSLTPAPFANFSRRTAAHNHLGETWSFAGLPLVISGFDSLTAPLHLANATGDALYIGEAGLYGVNVQSATLAGIFVNSSNSNGFDATTANHTGLNIGTAGVNGVNINTAGVNGVRVGTAGSNGVRIESAGVDGFHVGAAGEDGVHVTAAGSNGIRIDAAGDDGVFVGSAGTPSSTMPSTSKNGIEVAGAQGNGLYVGWANSDGIRIFDASDDGIQIGDGTNSPNYGLFVPSPGTAGNTLIPNTSDANGEWALATTDKISAGNVAAASITLVARVEGEAPVEKGDLLAASGFGAPIPGGVGELLHVRAADESAWSGLAGVVESRMELIPLPGKEDEPGGAPLTLRSKPGPAQPGDLVAVTIAGVARVKVDPAAAGAIKAGQRLTASAAPGRARPLRVKSLDGMAVAESAPTIGVALASYDPDGSEARGSADETSEADATAGLIPVFVNLR